MEQSENIIELLTALCAARVEFPPIVRNREGFSKRGGQKYQYADLNAIIDATAPVLAAHGLTMMQFIEDSQEETHAVVKSILSHLSGQWIASQLTVKRADDPQNFGIETTYAKRYVQQAMLNISTEDDPDGLTSETKVQTRARETDGRQGSSEGTIPATSRGAGETKASPPVQPKLPKPSKDEVTKLMNLLREVYVDKAVVDEKLRAVLQIPSGQVWTDYRIRTELTGEHCAQLTREATAHATNTILNQDTDLESPSTVTDDVPITPPTDTSPPDEGLDSHVEPALSSESASMAGGHVDTTDGRGDATVEQLTDLKDLAAKVSPEAADEVQQAIDQCRGRLPREAYDSMLAYLQKQEAMAAKSTVKV